MNDTPVIIGIVAVLLSATAAAGVEPAGKVRAAPAKCVSVSGVLLSREEGKSWQTVKPGEPIRSGALLVGLPQAEITSANGAVLLKLLADIGQRGPFPVLEAAVTLHDNAAVDLDVRVDRGVVSLVNLKKEGAAKVRLRFLGQSWDLTLLEPGTRVGVELYGRHPPGLPLLGEGKAEDPTLSLVLLVVHGQAFLDTGGMGSRLVAPPGQALVQWDNLFKQAEVGHLDTLPEGIRPPDDKESKIFEEVSASARRLTGRPMKQALEELVKSDRKSDRLVGVTVLGALDEVPQLLDALADASHADARNHAILVLRHWLGRGPGQVGKLYHALTRDQGYADVHAKTILQLLFGFDDQQRGQPATFELLLDYLQHSKLPVRELAHWHLVRLAPAGRDIPYDAAAPEAQRQQGYEQWRALIPEGRLPPSPKAPPAGQK